MKLKELNLENEFTVIVKGDFQFSNYGYKENIFSNEDYESVVSFLIIAQDIYNKLNEIEEYTEDSNIAECLTPFVNVYLDKFTDHYITDLYDNDGYLIGDKISELLPESGDSTYIYPLSLEQIKIIKDGKTYIFEKQQSNKDIKKAQECVINWLNR